MTLEELELEIGQTMWDVAQNPSPQVVRLAVCYLMETIKRYRTKGITRVRVRQLAQKATERRIRNEDARKLQEMLNNAEQSGATIGSGKPDSTEHPRAAGTEAARAVEDTGPAVDRAESHTPAPDPAVVREAVEPPPTVPEDVPWEGGAFNEPGRDYSVDHAVRDDRGTVPPVEGAGRPGEELPAQSVIIQPGLPRQPSGRSVSSYSVCLSCGNVQGNLEAGAKKIYIPKCGVGSCGR